VARLYSDENFPVEVVEQLRLLGHDVWTSQEAEQSNRGIPDSEVLSFATLHEHAVLTINRWDFVRLHRQQPDHSGIICCSRDHDVEALAQRIHEAIIANQPLQGKLIRVNRPS
jgi:hypothetical protein